MYNLETPAQVTASFEVGKNGCDVCRRSVQTHGNMQIIGHHIIDLGISVLIITVKYSEYAPPFYFNEEEVAFSIGTRADLPTDNCRQLHEGPEK